MYAVETKHYTKDWVNGDLCSKLELTEVKHFNTRALAKNYLESKLQGKNNVSRQYHKGDKPSYALYFTGVTWTEENTGEEREEYYQFILKKIKV